MQFDYTYNSKYAYQFTVRCIGSIIKKLNILLGTIISNNTVNMWNIYEDSHNQTCVTIRFVDIEDILDQPVQYRRVNPRQTQRNNVRAAKHNQNNTQTSQISRVPITISQSGSIGNHTVEIGRSSSTDHNNVSFISCDSVELSPDEISQIGTISTCMSPITDDIHTKISEIGPGDTSDSYIVQSTGEKPYATSVIKKMEC